MKEPLHSCSALHPHGPSCCYRTHPLITPAAKMWLFHFRLSFYLLWRQNPLPLEEIVYYTQALPFSHCFVRHQNLQRFHWRKSCTTCTCLHDPTTMNEVRACWSAGLSGVDEFRQPYIYIVSLLASWARRPKKAKTSSALATPPSFVNHRGETCSAFMRTDSSETDCTACGWNEKAAAIWAKPDQIVKLDGRLGKYIRTRAWITGCGLAVVLTRTQFVLSWFGGDSFHQAIHLPWQPELVKLQCSSNEALRDCAEPKTRSPGPCRKVWSSNLALAKSSSALASAGHMAPICSDTQLLVASCSNDGFVTSFSNSSQTGQIL